ncbi:hypothetical protein DAI22_05g099700 [Oryza sativa Japonica Group]|nr:hypothetical protein DAI22_05g099700 [Oryza sativa Japonica Group]
MTFSDNLETFSDNPKLGNLKDQHRQYIVKKNYRSSTISCICICSSTYNILKH